MNIASLWLYMFLSFSSLVGMELTLSQAVDEKNIVFLVEGNEIKVPERYVRLMGLAPLDDLELAEAFPLPNVTMRSWKIIENQLPRLYCIKHEEGDLIAHKQAMKDDIDALMGEQLMELMCSLDYLDIPLLFELADEAFFPGKKVAANDLRFLSEHLCASLLSDKIHAILGVMPVARTVRKLGSNDIRCILVVDQQTIAMPTWGNDIVLFDPWGPETVVYEGQTVYAESQWVCCKGHKGYIRALCLAPDDFLISASDDKTVRIWDRQGRQQGQCLGHEAAVTCVCTAREGVIVSGSEDKTVRIWNKDGQQLFIITGYTGSLNGVTILEEKSSSKIISSSYQKEVHIHDFKGQRVALLTGHVGNVSASGLLPGNKIASAAFFDDYVRVWATNGTPITSYNFKDVGSPVCFLDDAKVLLQHEDYPWCLATVKGRKLFIPVSKERSMAHCARFMNRETLLVGCSDGLYVYDLSLLYRLFDMTSEQAEKCWKVLEQVVDREKAILGLESTLKMIEEYRLAQDKHEQYWPAIEKILAEESVAQ